jgi:EpsI family protein
MTTRRLAILFIVLAAGLSGVFALPKQMGFQPKGVVLELPDSLGEWWGQHVEVTQHEKNVLGRGTEFSRKEYSNGRGDLILASVVLSGEDMMTSIHRPERCLRAQGWTFNPGDERVINVPGHGRLPVMRLRNHKTIKNRDGQTVPIENICYYWFAGSRDVTESHLSRVWIDLKDRLAGGYAQRWAMFMVAANITGKQMKFGRDEKGTDEVLVEFIRQLAPQMHTEAIRYR